MSTIPLISLVTVRHLVKRIEIFQEQIVSMCGRAEYGGGRGAAGWAQLKAMRGM